MKVIKFGGSSLADGPQLQKVINIIQADPTRQVVTVSAPGKRFDGDTKVTDLLLQYAQLTIAGGDTQAIVAEILQRYRSIVAHFNLDESKIIPVISEQLHQLANNHYPSFAYLKAAFAGHGELLNAQLVAYILRETGNKARFVSPKELGMLTTGAPQAAMLDESAYQKMAWFHLEADEIIVVPGFLAYNADGYMTTFKRGGSDITGAILARGLHADLYENFTDVSYIFAASPKIIANPVPIKMMTYREMRELAYAGFAVFSDEAIVPVIKAGIQINVKNTNAPDEPGTLIVPDVDYTAVNSVTGIASDTRFAALYLHRYLLNNEVGFTRNLLDILLRHDISYEHMPTGIDDLSIIFDKSLTSQAQFDAMMADIKAEIQPDIMEWMDDYALIMVVGEGMHKRIGAVTNIIQPLAGHGISLQMINQGASRISVMLGLPSEQVDEAVKVIYANNF
ncbi:MAG: aspartate kinase [Lactobacillaceae bacterium]|nr:aspartate kinase [Lactobacillaceae bacterium]